MNKPHNYEEYLAADETYEDLPDGAYFAAMEDAGFDTDYMIEVEEYERTRETLPNKDVTKLVKPTDVNPPKETPNAND